MTNRELGVQAFRSGFDQASCPFQVGTTGETDWMAGFTEAAAMERVLFPEFKRGQWANYCGIDDVQILECITAQTYKVQHGQTTFEADISELGAAMHHDKFACDEPPYFNLGKNLNGKAIRSDSQ